MNQREPEQLGSWSDLTPDEVREGLLALAAALGFALYRVPVEKSTINATQIVARKEET